MTVQRVKSQTSSASTAKSRKSSQDRTSTLSPPTTLVRQRSSNPGAYPKDATPIHVMYAPELGRKQLHEIFLSIYSPRDTAGPKGTRLNFLHDIAEMAPLHPAVADSLDTLALAQIGSVHRDERVCNAAIAAYGRALRTLASAMSRAMVKGYSDENDTLLAAANLLVVCEFFDPIKTQGAGWFGHIAGVEQLTFARGPKAHRSELGLMLLLNSRHGSIARSYLLRKTDPYGSPAWRAAVHKLYSNDHRQRVFDLTVQVPGLLERFDGLSHGSSLALDEADALLADCERLEVDLRSFYEGLQTMEDSALYILAPVDSFSAFAAAVSDRTLPTAYRFKDFTLGYVHSQYWIAMHHLRTTIKSLDEYRESLDLEWQPGRNVVTLEELNEYIFDLCRCLPYLIEPEAGTQGHIGTFLPLATIMMSFRSRQNWKWLKWGLCVKEGIYNKGLSQPHVREEDLPVARQFPRGETPFDHGASPITLDDLKDVNLTIDWGSKTPGMSVAVTGLPDDDADLADDFELMLELDKRLVKQDYLPTQSARTSNSPSFEMPY